MHRSTFCLLAVATLAACHSYRADPVDLAGHAAAFARGDLHALRPPTSTDGTVQPDDGLDRSEGRIVAMGCHPDCRIARARLDQALAEEGQAGRLDDPELSADALRILESGPHRWLAGAGVSFTVPWSGRLAAARAVAGTKSHAALEAVLAAEAAAADAADAAWVRWSGARERVTLLDAACSDLTDLASIADRLAAADALSRQGARVFTLELRQREHDRALATAAVARTEAALKQALGVHPAAKATLVPGLELEPRLPADRRSALLPATPRVVAAVRAHAVADAELRLELKKQWPDLVLGPRWEEEDAQPRLGLGLMLPLPFFAGNDAAIVRAESARTVAKTIAHAELERATHALAEAELRLAEAERSVHFVHDTLLPLGQAQLADGRTLAAAGQLDPLLLLDAITRVHDTRLQLLDARLERALAVVHLNTCTGIELPVPTAEEVRR
ncbi:MAG: TolC family protein [Planctomycetes bacterium]|nr:TolC family protein [Planctomycetota bacterium]